MTGWIIEYWSRSQDHVVTAEHNTLGGALLHACDFVVQNKGDKVQRIKGPNGEMR
jgi:hypothetical protein